MASPFDRPEGQRCGTCMFYGNHGYGLGPCRRRAPQVVGTSAGTLRGSKPIIPTTAWPDVHDTNWCGEWQQVGAA